MSPDRRSRLERAAPWHPDAGGHMNVLFLAHSFPRWLDDPVGSFVLRLAIALRDEGITVRVVSPEAPGVPATAEFDGIHVDRFPYAPEHLETLAYTGAMRDRVRESWSGRAALGGLITAGGWASLRAARRGRAEVIHAHWWFPGGFTGAIVSRLSGIPLVTTLHGSDLRLARTGALRTRLFAAVARRSATVTTVSRWLADEAESLMPGLSPVVAPMPVNPALFPLREFPVHDRLLFVGKLNEQKGIVPLLHALARMRHRPVVDVVVGVGSDEAAAHSLAEQLGVASQLRWFPLLDQAALAERYRAATALVVPAVDEGLGLTAVEALLSGTPVVAFASGGLPDIVIDGQTGRLVPPGDIGALAAALDALLDSPDQGSALGATGRRHALARFSPSAAAQRYADVYREARARAR